MKSEHKKTAFGAPVRQHQGFCGEPPHLKIGSGAPRRHTLRLLQPIPSRAGGSFRPAEAPAEDLRAAAATRPCRRLRRPFGARGARRAASCERLWLPSAGSAPAAPRWRRGGAPPVSAVLRAQPAPQPDGRSAVSLKTFRCRWSPKKGEKRCPAASPALILGDANVPKSGTLKAGNLFALQNRKKAVNIYCKYLFLEHLTVLLWEPATVSNSVGGTVLIFQLLHGAS